ncbi:hypothetical protein BDV93DRAFT_608308 [Ceratobasidium sp. AG-I]|nr:hypothetical protein BDV93DRAFT_608308 [Ceratobasidium sp. AG-I]
MKKSTVSSPEKYNLVVGGRKHVLFRSQIERDSPNFFTSYFLDPSDQVRNKNTRLDISRDPDIFDLVLRYLNGYHVLPIHDRLVPPTSTPETVLADLRADAEFYQLRGLLDLCDAAGQKRIMEVVDSYAMISGYLRVSKDGMSPTEDLEMVIPRFSISLLSEDTYNEEAKGMTTMTNETIRSPHYPLVSSWSNQIVRGVLSKQPSGFRRFLSETFLLFEPEQPPSRSAPVSKLISLQQQQQQHQRFSST